MSTNNASQTDGAFQRAAYRWLSDMFAEVPEVTRIPVPELHYCVIFGNLDQNAVLSEVAVDKAGRFWRHDRETDELVMFFDPATVTAR